MQTRLRSSFQNLIVTAPKAALWPAPREGRYGYMSRRCKGRSLIHVCILSTCPWQAWGPPHAHHETAVASSALMAPSLCLPGCPPQRQAPPAAPLCRLTLLVPEAVSELWQHALPGSGLSCPSHLDDPAHVRGGGSPTVYNSVL